MKKSSLPSSILRRLSKLRRKGRRGTAPRYTLELINRSTQNRIWYIRFTRTRLVIVSLISVAALIALIAVVIYLSPASHILPRSASENISRDYMEMAYKLDSLQERIRVSEQYTSNIATILSGKPVSAEIPGSPGVITDTLMVPTVLEQEFVNAYDERNRYNLSVLSPIAAEGMAFYAPVTDVPVEVATGTTTAVITPAALTPVDAVYRGTVLDVTSSAMGVYTVIIQHLNNFISIYGGLTEVLVAKGSTVRAGTPIGFGSTPTPLTFELWHDGTALDPTQYINF
ncbi:MAG: M23 family metallopeptidase [Muribaculaceae bacterium]|nr:M23 family metallopeptidase [Muribaculaceae bacterium]